MIEETYIEILIGIAIVVGFTLEFALGTWLAKMYTE